MTGVDDGYVATHGNDESDDSDDDGNDIWFSDPSQMLLSVGGKPPATSLYCQHQFCRKEEIHHTRCLARRSNEPSAPQKVQNKLSLYSHLPTTTKLASTFRKAEEVHC